MVYHGPSKGCNPCRKRRVKCDESKPYCGNCVKRKQQHICVYRNHFDAIHKDNARYQKETSTSGTGSDSSDSSPEYWADQSLLPYNTLSRRQSPPYRTPPPLFAPAVDPELDSLCFFFNNYVNLPREPQSNIFVEHILPLWKRSSDNSSLKHATAAVAANIHQLWRMQGPDSPLSRAKYGQALNALRQTFSDPHEFNSDEALGTMFMLDFHESLNRRYQQAIDLNVHQKAAMSLVSSRGRNSFQSETSRRLFTALRARYILFNLQAKRRVDLDEELLQEDPEMDLPGAKLDLVLADLANAMYSGRHLLEPGSAPLSAGSGFPVVGGSPAHTPEPTDFDMTFEVLLSYLLETNLRLNAWKHNLPPSWQAHRIHHASQTLHYSIRAVGLYNGLCDVYSSTAVAHSHNGWRSSKVLVLRLIKHCLRHLPPDSPSKSIMPGDTIDTQIQGLVDDICASVPFHLGSRTTLALPHEHHEYPPVPAHVRASANYVDSSGRPTTMTDNDHVRNAASIGGWFVLTPLTAMMRYAQPFPEGMMINTSQRLEPIKLRPGQYSWIMGQVRRIHKIYQIPMPPSAAAIGRGGGPAMSGGGPAGKEVEVGMVNSDTVYHPGGAVLWLGQEAEKEKRAYVEPSIRDSLLSSGGWLGGGAGKEETFGGGIPAVEITEEDDQDDFPMTESERDLLVDNRGRSWVPI